MTTTVLQGISLIAMVASLPLLSWGTTSDTLVLSIAGAVLLIAGMVMLTVLRYMKTEEES